MTGAVLSLSRNEEYVAADERLHDSALCDGRASREACIHRHVAPDGVDMHNNDQH
jgi:hypothetical protein